MGAFVRMSVLYVCECVAPMHVKDCSSAADVRNHQDRSYTLLIEAGSISQMQSSLIWLVSLGSSLSNLLSISLGWLYWRWGGGGTKPIRTYLGPYLGPELLSPHTCTARAFFPEPPP